MSVRECTQCEANTKSGARCKRKTCIYAAYCYQHTRSILGLYISQSSIPNSGLGLYTAKAIKKGKKVADYTGVIVGTKAWNEGGEGDYGVQLNKREVLDARSTQTALGRYANDCRDRNRRKKECPGRNARFVVNTRRKTVYIKATKNIPAHSEIFVSYGRQYWL